MVNLSLLCATVLSNGLVQKSEDTTLYCDPLASAPQNSKITAIEGTHSVIPEPVTKRRIKNNFQKINKSQESSPEINACLHDSRRLQIVFGLKNNLMSLRISK